MGFGMGCKACQRRERFPGAKLCVVLPRGHRYPGPGDDYWGAPTPSRLHPVPCLKEVSLGSIMEGQTLPANEVQKHMGTTGCATLTPTHTLHIWKCSSKAAARCLRAAQAWRVQVGARVTRCCAVNVLSAHLDCHRGVF